MQISTFIMLCRTKLGLPSEAVLGDEIILLSAWENISMLGGALNVTNNEWQLASADLTIPVGPTEQMLINRPDFGYAVFIHTIDPSNPYHVRRTVDIDRVSEMSKWWSGPDIQIGAGWIPHVAAVFAIWYDQGNWNIGWRPRHAQSCQYRMWYTRGASTMPPLFDDVTSFPIEEQNFFLVSLTVKDLMPMTADPDTGLDERQKLLLAAAESKIQQWTPIFEAERWEGVARQNQGHRKIYGESRVPFPIGSYR